MMRERKKDKIEIVGTVILISVCVGLIIATLIELWNLGVKKTDDIENFFNRKYELYNGGKEAKQFFGNYVELEEYKDIAFHYCDGEKYIGGWHKTYTVFIVDIYYEEDVFYEVAEKILPDTDDADKTEMSKNINNFQISKIVLREELYQKNTAYVMFDLKYNTIRYVFIYDCPADNNIKVVDLLRWVFPDLNWNFWEGDLIFDYNK